MSEKNAKMDRKLKAIEGGSEDIDWEKAAKEQAEQIHKMYEDRDKKALAAKEHLVSCLEVTVMKYLTANGVISALETLRTVHGDCAKGYNIQTDIQSAQKIAGEMSDITKTMMDKAKQIEPENMEDLCNGFYDTNVTTGVLNPNDLAKQLMILSLCQNVGPDAQDVSDFCKTADKEIAKAREALQEFCKEHDVDYLKVCGVKEYTIGLCTECVNDCKDDSKLISDGESAREICENFESISFE